MAYACGECFPQYQVTKLLSVEKDKKKLKYLIGKDIYVEFTKEMMTEIDGKTWECQTCYFYEVSGQLTNKDTSFVLTARDYKMYERFKNCCEDFRKRLKDGRKNQTP